MAEEANKIWLKRSFGALLETENMWDVAGRKGFEPSRRFNPPTPLAGERLQPLGHLPGAGIGFKRMFDKFFLEGGGKRISL